MFSSTYLLPLALIPFLAHASDDLCMGACVGSGDAKVCTFALKVDLHASELGYYTVDGCDGIMPTLGVEKGVTYIFDQGDASNYYHPLGLAYYADGAHDDVDELEPGIPPPGSASSCADDELCPAPMYLKGGEYLGDYSNNEAIAPIASSDNFGLDDYEPEFFLDFLTWKTAGKYTIALKFDVDDFAQDFFYFCHIHQFMTGRMKFVDSMGNILYPDNVPAIPYEYETPSDYDAGCGTYGLGDYTLPHGQCPKHFVCDKPDGKVGAFAGCLDSMNCAMTVGMTTNVNSNSAIALFNHQMIPHHQNAVNMCKALFKSGELMCDDIEDEDNPHCAMTYLCYELINNQNFQIQAMRGVLDTLGYDDSDDCEVYMKTKKQKKHKKKSHKHKHVTPTVSPAPTVCEDSTERFSVNGVTQACQWVLNGGGPDFQGATPYRCNKYSEAAENCKQTCGVCGCQDTSARFFVSGQEGSKSCKWVARKYSKKRCTLDNVKFLCPATCDNCSPL